MGLKLEQLRDALPSLDKIGFPKPDPLFADRRYWPAVKAFLDRRYGLAAASGQGIPALDGVESWKRKKSA
nr:winged helix-turn-helix domain-containing protein [Gellertiella hungarica]